MTKQMIHSIENKVLFIFFSVRNWESSWDVGIILKWVVMKAWAHMQLIRKEIFFQKSCVSLTENQRKSSQEPSAEVLFP